MHLKVQNGTKCLRRDITPTILLIFMAIYTGKKYIFQYWNVVGLLLYYHWLIIGSFTGYSNFGKWLCFPTLEKGC